MSASFAQYGGVAWERDLMQERLSNEVPQEQFPTKRRKFCDIVSQELCVWQQLPADEAAGLHELQHLQGQVDKAAHEGQ